MRSSRTWKRVVAGALAAGLLVAACGDDDDSDSTEAPADTEAATEDTEAPADTEAAAAETPDELAGLTVVDDKTFTVELTEPDPEFNLRLAYSGFSPLPDAFFDDPAAFEEQPIGNGPFMMDGPWEHDVAINVTTNERFRGLS